MAMAIESRQNHQNGQKNELLQQEQQLAGMQHFVASLKGMPFLSQNLSFLPPPRPIPQSATGETKNSYVLFI